MSILNLIQPKLQQINKYIPQETGENSRLHANELPWCPLDDNDLELNYYPDSKSEQEIQEYLASMYEVDNNQIILTRGSDAGIDLLCRLFLNANQDALMQFPPTFAMYAFYTQLQGAKLIQCPLKETNDFILTQDQIDASWKDNCKIILFCRPNNPTGTMIDLDTIAATCERYSDQSLIVVDEAYLEFSKQESAISLIPRYENLIVLRTLSKAYGLAGLRLGSMIGQAKLIEAISNFIPPYTFSTAVLNLAKKALTQTDWFTKAVQRIKNQREWLVSQLVSIAYVEQIYPSEANFILIKTPYAKQLTNYLARQNITVRDFTSDASLKNFVRITVGNEQQNQTLMNSINTFTPGSYDEKNTIY